MKPNTIACIVWRDIAGVTENWSSKKEVLEEAQSTYDTVRRTYGEIIHETSKYIVLASTVSSTDAYHDTSMIMRSVIIRVEKLINPRNLKRCRK